MKKIENEIETCEGKRERESEGERQESFELDNRKITAPANKLSDTSWHSAADRYS